MSYSYREQNKQKNIYHLASSPSTLMLIMSPTCTNKASVQLNLENSPKTCHEMNRKIRKSESILTIHESLVPEMWSNRKRREREHRKRKITLKMTNRNQSAGQGSTSTLLKLKKSDTWIRLSPSIRHRSMINHKKAYHKKRMHQKNCST